MKPSIRVVNVHHKMFDATFPIAKTWNRS